VSTVHLHATHAEPGDTVCRVACGRECGDSTTTAYGSLDPERVTCTECLTFIGKRSTGRTERHALIGRASYARSIGA